MDSWTNKGLFEIWSQNLDFETGTIKASLLTNVYSGAATKQTTQFWSGISSTELVATGYSTQTLGTKSITLDNVNNLIRFMAADYGYTITGSATFRYLAIWNDTGNPATSVVLAVIDKGGDQTRTNQSLNIEFTDGTVLKWDNNLVTSHWTNYGLWLIAKQDLDWDGHDIEAVMLDTYTGNTKQNIQFMADVLLNGTEVSATGYSRTNLATKSTVNNNLNDVIEFKANPYTLTITGTINFRWIPIIRNITNDASSPVLAVLDKGSLQSKTDTDVTISEAANIWLKINN